jgi:tetratricopeptide (TPR) repeat protein
VRATALDQLRASATPDIARKAAALLNDKVPLIRLAALRLMAAMPAQSRAEVVLPLLRDPMRSVRLEAALLMIGVQTGQIPRDDRAAVVGAVADYQRSLFVRADYPETQMQIAGLSMALRKFDVAQEALRTAVTLDPQLAVGWLTLARIQVALTRPDQASETLEMAAEKLPDNAQIWFQLGLATTALRRHGRAVEVLEKSRALLPRATPALLDLLATNYLLLGKADRAGTYADQLVADFPNHRISRVVRQFLQARDKAKGGN